MNQQVKLCINCTHYSPPEHSFQSPEQFSRCAAGDKFNVVTGTPIKSFCDINRNKYGICGPEAILYVAKVEVTHE